eukprot:35924-Eustigmatos_ZCMA.PRE.1
MVVWSSVLLLNLSPLLAQEALPIHVILRANGSWRSCLNYSGLLSSYASNAWNAVNMLTYAGTLTAVI